VLIYKEELASVDSESCDLLYCNNINESEVMFFEETSFVLYNIYQTMFPL